MHKKYQPLIKHREDVLFDVKTRIMTISRLAVFLTYYFERQNATKTDY